MQRPEREVVAIDAKNKKMKIFKKAVDNLRFL